MHSKPSKLRRPTAGRSVCSTGLACALAAALVGLAVGCAPSRYARQADKAAYGAVEEKQRLAMDKTRQFKVEYQPYQAGAEGEANQLDGRPIPMANQPSRVLSLEQCLRIALRNSRPLQEQKESLYAAALALDNMRRKWTLLGGALTGGASRSVTQNGPDSTGGTGEAGNSLTQKLATGGSAALGIGLSAASDLAGMNSSTAGSLASASMTQPLLRGAWRDFAKEPLYRQERDVAIAVLEYERYRETLAADIRAGYFAVLRQKDTVANEESNIERLEQALRRTQVQVEGGEVSRIQQDQTEHDLLAAKVRLASLRQQYRQGLDQYKLTLGLPVEAQVELDSAELAGLNEQGPSAMPFFQAAAIDEAVEEALAAADQEAQERRPAADAPASEQTAWQKLREELIQRRRQAAAEQAFSDQVARASEDAVETAFSARPDILRQRSALRDAKRNVQMAGDSFNPGANLSLGLNAPSAPPRDVMQIQTSRHTRSAGLGVDYSFDQTDNRDLYRLAQLEEARQRRDYLELLDRVRFDVRQAYRNLTQTQRTYNLQKQNLVVAQRRRSLAALEQTAGEASARDVLEAEDALREAQNGLSEALVDYETTRVRFLASLGLLAVDDVGKVHERDEPVVFDRITERYKATTGSGQ